MMSEQDVDSTQKDQEAAWYSALLNAWITTKFEIDKTIIALSSAGIGLLVTLSSSVGHLGLLCVYVTACISFLISIIFSMFALHYNAGYVEKLILKRDIDAKDEAQMKVIDGIARIFFGIGLLSLVILGIGASF